MDKLTEKLISNIFGEVKSRGGKLHEINLEIWDLSSDTPAVKYSVVTKNDSGLTTVSKPLPCKTSSGNRYHKANIVATEVYTYFTAREVPVKLFGKKFEF